MFQPIILMPAAWIPVSPVDNATLRVPFILTVELNNVTDSRGERLIANDNMGRRIWSWSK